MKRTPTLPDLVVIGCGKTKLETNGQPVAACQLYDGPLFRARWRYAVELGAPVAILSAKLGLVHPAALVETYDVTVKDLDPCQRAEWVLELATALLFSSPVAWVGGRPAVVEIHAGRDYVKAMREVVLDTDVVLTTPMAGLGIGQQLAVYKATHESVRATGTSAVNTKVGPLALDGLRAVQP